MGRPSKGDGRTPGGAFNPVFFVGNCKSFVAMTLSDGPVRPTFRLRKDIGNVVKREDATLARELPQDLRRAKPQVAFCLPNG